MKKIFIKLQGRAVPIILGIALLLTGILSSGSIKNLQGNARVINYIGIVRGATQRLIKKELNHLPDDEMIVWLDEILSALSDGSNNLNLIRLQNSEFQELLVKMKEQWIEIKSEIIRYRRGESGKILFELSEDYFNLANSAVLAAEKYTENMVENTRKVLFFMDLVFIILAVLCGVSAFYQEKRQKKFREAEQENQRKSEHLARMFQEILVPMNEISELMYISDINTYDLLFINKAGKESFHLDENKKMKCYQALQGLDAPCSFCTIPYIKMDENYTWEFTNPITKRHYLLKDRLVEWEGRFAKMEIAFDITEAANEKIELQSRLESDKVLLECIRELHRNHDINKATVYVLEQAGRLFLAERAYIFVLQEGYLSNTAEWCMEGVKPQIDNLQKLPQSDFRVWLDIFSKQENIIIKDVEDLKETLELEYRFLSNQEIKSIVMVPLEKEGKLSGLIGLDNLSADLLENAVSFLQTLRYFLMLATRRNEDEEMLSKLSYEDILTSFYNRNRYIRDIEVLTGKDSSIGIVYLDVNGLKEINDNLGHDAGDKMLKECAKTIQRIFKIGSFYRIGGDEFVIICTDIEKEEFNKTVYNLKNSFKNGNCKAAIGSQWAEKCENIQSIITAADKLMYADKKAFYNNHPPSRRYRHHNNNFRYLADPVILKEKIDKKQFLVYLQPEMDIESHVIVGAEALVYYQDENGGMESPDKFIPILEEAKLTNQVDFYAFESICAKIREWERRGEESIVISNNFSSSSFLEKNFGEHLEEICKKYEVPKKYLKIQITRDTNGVDYRELKVQIDKVRNLGFPVSLNDFEMKSSNLAILSMITFDVWKLGKSFAENIITNTNVKILVETIAELCEKMDIQLVVKGVENEEQDRILKKCSVKTVQGFEPISIEEYERKYFHKK